MLAKRMILASVIVLIQLIRAGACTGWEGKVVEVYEGDTISVSHEGGVERVHLFGINSPLKGQPFHEEAKSLTRWLVRDKEVSVIEITKGSYGVIDALVRVHGYRDLTNAKLVSYGMAWVDEKYCNTKLSVCGELKRLQELAKLNGIGLWSGINPISPREWRRQQTMSQPR